jgi:hypothetical protein
MQNIHLKFSDSGSDSANRSRFAWSRDDLVDMIATIQESGADGLRNFQIVGYLMGRHEGFTAERVGWLDVASQPKLKGEWKVNLTGSPVV